MYFTQKRLKIYLGALLVLQLFAFISFRDSIRSGAIDFRSYYTAGYMLRTGQSRLLYNYRAEQRFQNALIAPAPIALPFYALPFAAVPFVPLSLFPYLPSLLVFALINLALLGLAVVVMRPHLAALSARWRALPPLLFLSFLPVAFTVAMGQLSIALLLIDCLAFALLEAEQPILAGLVFSLALLKFQTALPVAALFLLWRRWRFIAGFLAGAAILGALSIWILGLHGLIPYLRSITQMSALAGTQLQFTVGVAPRRMANLYGLLFMLTPTNHLATILTIVASVLLIAWAVTRRPSLPLALLIALLISYHFYPCDLTLLLLPISLLCDSLFAEEAPAEPPSSRFPWLGRYRRLVLLCALGIFLLGPALAEFISNDLIFLLALPILALAFCPCDWSTLTLPTVRSTSSVSRPHPATA